MGRSSTPLSSHAAQTRSAKGISGKHRAEYVERGVTGKSTYYLCFADGRVTGKGWDADGDFQVFVNLVLPDRRWSVRSEDWRVWPGASGLSHPACTVQVKLLWDGEKYVGEYRSNMAMSGSLVLKSVS